MKVQNIDYLREYVVSCYPQEAVGYVEREMFFPLENVHPDPVDHFLVGEGDGFMLAGKDYILIHSHCMTSFKNDPRTPSLADMQGQKDTAKLWGIVHCDGENVSEILYFGLPTDDPLLGRTYIRNVYDCFSLARDYYHTKDIVAPNLPRPPDWEEWNPYLMVRGLEQTKFKEVPKGMVQEGDLLVFKVASPQPNHLGIALGGDVFVHHLYNRVSCRDSLKKWHNQFIKVLRYAV